MPSFVEVTQRAVSSQCWFSVYESRPNFCSRFSRIKIWWQIH